ncbi:MAG: FtsX-like permease family protein, partial [Candidatus Dormiibacterota bacterium]
MRRLILHQLRHRPGRGLALGAGILVAAVSFSLLTAATATEVAQSTSAVQSNLSSAYDIVVFAATKSTPKPGGLVPANYLSGLYGGISLSQYKTVKSIPGVQIAAPIAVVGYILATVNVPINVTAVLRHGSSAVLELSDSRTADNGLTHYPAQPLGYVYVTPDSLVAEPTPNPASITDPFTTIEAMQETLPDGATRQVCPQPFAAAHGSPFADYQADDAACWSWSTGSGSGGSAGSQPSITADLQVSLPLLVVAIDPTAEAELDGLDRAVVEGRYLSERGLVGKIPVLASTGLEDGDVDTVTVSRLPSSAVGVVQGGGTPSGVAATLAAESGTPVTTDVITAGHEYSDLLRLGMLGGSEGFGGPSGIDAYWETGTVGYTTSGTVLDPHPTTSTAANLGAWDEFGSLSDYEQDNPALSGNGQYESTQHVGWEAVPIDDSDTAYRSLDRVPDTQFGGGPVGPVYPPWQLVGTFDPSRVQEFSALSAVPLEFAPPVVTGADAASRKALGNQPLEPDSNIAGYLQEPPVLFTSLAGLSVFGDVLPYTESRAPISSIRVRVGGLTGTVPERLAEVARVANRIHQETELQVVTTAGSSPTTETIALPGGKYGRPALLLHESWVHLGVALVIVSALNRTSVAFFVLVLVVTVLFLINGSVAAVRGRRREIGVLRCTGWQGRAIFRLILGELLLLGTLAGVVGAGITLAVILGLHLDMPLWRVALIMPVAALLAGLA